MYVSLTTILAVAFFAYISHSVYQMSQLFNKLTCTGTPCYTSFLDERPQMQLALFMSPTRKPLASEVTEIYSTQTFKYVDNFDQDLTVDVPLKTRRNGTLYMHVVLALKGEPLEWRSLRRDGPTIVHTLSLTDYIVPRTAFNLLSDAENKPAVKRKTAKTKETVGLPKTHLRSQVYVTLLTDTFSMSHADVPPELAQHIHVNRYHQILPILKTDTFNTRIKDLVLVSSNTTEFTFSFHYKPVSVGKLRLMLLMEHATEALIPIGFARKDIDEVKGLFSDTNIYLLCGTIFISSLHMLFDFLSFKNDVAFWRRKTSYEGLSTSTTLWRAFSQIVILMFLMDEDSSMLVVVPVAVGAVIELWKCKKILRLELSFSSFVKRRLEEQSGDSNQLTTERQAERQTEQFDKQGMRYLSYLLYPLCLAGAIYSLVYQTHRSWYSWTVNSLVNGVYAFGFLFMLPQLFVNYKLKSVAALPWRAFMYKAFNTFIDDFFAFIISMPTAHRVACLRDDIVFLIYLYQRWLYPVDNKRTDSDAAVAIAAPPTTNGNSAHEHQD